jgi:arylsulfatase A-like enzyme
MVGLVSIGVAAVWLVVTYWIGPAMIRAAYEGRSFDFLNRIIQGQADHPVEEYLNAFRSLANKAMGRLLVAGAVLLVGYLARAPLNRMFRRINRSTPQLAPRHALLVSLWIGIVLGLFEVTSAWIRWTLKGVLTFSADPKTFYVAPLTQGLLFLLLATLAVRLIRFRQPTVSGRLVSGAFFSLGLVGVFLRGVSHLHIVAAVILSLGIGVRLAGWLAERPRWWALTRQTAVPMAAALLILMIGIQALGPWMREKEIASLPQAVRGMPNILLLVLDTVRGENLGLLGYERPTTPSLARHAARGAVFENGIAPAPWTLPTHASLMTGRDPSELSAGWSTPLDDTHPVLAEFLRHRGVVTGGFVANRYYTNRGTGLGRGFVDYQDYPLSLSEAARSTWAATKTVGPIWTWLTGRVTTTRKDAPSVNAEFLGWLEGVGIRPFFAFLNYFDAHDPYLLFEDTEVVLNQGDPPATVVQEDGTHGPREKELAEAMDRYDTGVAFIDLHIGRLLDSLEVLGILENTIVIITSDHGEHFGERGVVQHSRSLYTQLIRVPLIFIYPPSVPSIRVKEAVSLNEVAVTIMGLVGLENSPFPGESLARFWGSDGDQVQSLSPARSVAYPKPSWDDISGPIRHGTMRSVVFDRLHYIRTGDGSEELFDIIDDPKELHDLSGLPESAGPMSRLRAMLEPPPR